MFEVIAQNVRFYDKFVFFCIITELFIVLRFKPLKQQWTLYKTRFSCDWFFLNVKQVPEDSL